MAVGAEIGSQIIGLMGQFGLSAYNNAQARNLAEYDRQQNYMYGEMAANNADKRTRGLYNSFYSPEALLSQYQEAGLSPSMMYGGTPGQGGMSGAQGSGANGIQTPYIPVSMLEAAQAANLFAQTKKTNAETSNIKEDTAIKEIQEEMLNMTKTLQSVEYTILGIYAINSETGEKVSLYRLAENYKTYEEFYKHVSNLDNATEEIKAKLATEQGQRTLRAIYMAGHQFNRDIAVLGEEQTNAVFQQSIITALKAADYAHANAESVIASLRNNVETQSLNARQQAAWNHLLDGIANKTNPDVADVVIMMAMLINNAMSNYNIPGLMAIP